MDRPQHLLQVQTLFYTCDGSFSVSLDWAIGCPDIWANITLGVSGRVFLGELVD